MNKLCEACGEIKDLIYFYKRKDKKDKPYYSRHCKGCTTKAAVRRGIIKETRRRRWLNIYKLRKGCSHCGYNKCSSALEFHHVHASEKQKGIAGMLTGSLRNLIMEIRKCVIVCSNCHRELHHEEQMG